MSKEYTTEKRVSCDGGRYEGHPLVYLDVAKKGEVKCPYCGRHFVSTPKSEKVSALKSA